MCALGRANACSNFDTKLLQGMHHHSFAFGNFGLVPCHFACVESCLAVCCPKRCDEGTDDLAGVYLSGVLQQKEQPRQRQVEPPGLSVLRPRRPITTQWPPPPPPLRFCSVRAFVEMKKSLRHVNPNHLSPSLSSDPRQRLRVFQEHAPFVRRAL